MHSCCVLHVSIKTRPITRWLIISHVQSVVVTLYGLVGVSWDSPSKLARMIVVVSLTRLPMRQNLICLTLTSSISAGEAYGSLQ